MSTVLFVCLHNAGRSQMSQALFEQAAAGRHRALSAGSVADPEGRVHPQVVDVMREVGIDLAGRRPQRLTTELAEEADVVVTMGCGDSCPFIPGKRYVDWELPDPKGRPLEEVRATQGRDPQTGPGPPRRARRLALREDAGRARQRLLQVGPQVLDVLAPDADAQEVLGHDAALGGVAGAALQRRLDAAEAGGVREHPDRVHEARRRARRRRARGR